MQQWEGAVPVKDTEGVHGEWTGGSSACELYKSVCESTGSVAGAFDVLAEAALSLLRGFKKEKKKEEKNSTSHSKLS